MKRLWNWFLESHRWQHFLGGLLIGMGADGWYCALYIGAGVGAALEFKDKAWGGQWDWVDFALTFGGVMGGYGVIKLLFG